jgi:hypothetical protein
MGKGLGFFSTPFPLKPFQHINSFPNFKNYKPFQNFKQTLKLLKLHTITYKHHANER